MDSLDNIRVLPKLSHPSEARRTFKLIWVLDLVSDSSQCYVSLLFQNIDTGFIIVDTIPPELLGYCTVGSFFCNGKKLVSVRPDGQPGTFSIDSTDNNLIVEAGKAFSDAEYDLSLKGKNIRYSEACLHQLCFVQQVGDTKVIIPCFVLAASYYFKSTSLREAVLSRKLDSLFDTCRIDPATRHATIFLKPAGNISDAKYIARLKLDQFANQRFNLCKDHLYKHKEDKTYKPLKVDFPVKQKLLITARGLHSENDDGSKTFIVFQIESENSEFPFDSIDIEYEREEKTEETGGTFPVQGTKSSKQFTRGKPGFSHVRQLLESSPPAENKNAEAIEETHKPKIKTSSGEQKTPKPEKGGPRTDLSAQPPSPSEDPTSQVDVREREKERERVSLHLQLFEALVLTLRDHSVKIGETTVTVADFRYETSNLKPLHSDDHLTRKESYDGLPRHLRQVAYVWFTFSGKYVCLVEIDQEGLAGSMCSTQVLISDTEITRDSAESCVQWYIRSTKLSVRAAELKKEGVIHTTKNHPSSHNGEGFKSWRTGLINKVLQGG